METKTNVTTTATYRYISRFQEGYASVRNDKGHWGLIDHTGKEVVPCKYPSVDYLGGGLILICEDLKMSYKLDCDTLDVSSYRVLNLEGSTVISNDDGPISYAKEIDAFIVCKRGKYGVIDREGVTLVPYEYDHISDFREGLAEVEKDGRWGFIDAHGSVIVPIEYDEVGNFSEGIAVVMKGDLCGYVDTQGKGCLPLQYRFVGWMHPGNLALASIHDGERELFGLIDRAGNEVLPMVYEYVDLSFDGTMYCYRGVGEQVTHFVNRKSGTSFVVPGQHVHVRFPVDDTPCFGYSLGTRWGLMSREGKVILRPRYEGMPLGARDGRFVVGNRDHTRRRKSGRYYYNWGMINAKGHEVVPLMYDDMACSGEPLVVACYCGHYCVIDKENRLVIANGVSRGAVE